MIDRCHDLRLTPRPRVVLALLGVSVCAGLCLGLGGCANVGDSFASGAFVDPARYSASDCKQLETERKTLANRTAELQGLIAKAETGVGGSVVVELAYRNDYIATRAQAKLAEETWQRNKCAVGSPTAAVPAPAPAPPVDNKGLGSARSGSAVY